MAKVAASMIRLQTTNAVISVSPLLMMRYINIPREIRLRINEVVKLPQAIVQAKWPPGNSSGCISRLVVPIGHAKMYRLLMSAPQRDGLAIRKTKRLTRPNPITAAG